ncbi:polyphosphate polymerase domain-containing protein [Actinoplanes regularis]|uniref:VTC domain-containing protein n=1 Tax=Actinoplanes regularis TaxID=52697 RepID=A0A239ES29_9ACTN|nr:polyphosphate polymerase domain-containing protein [Actinoplanes regularis]GIE89813.1 VTC domain-containing protein [Actinoplanes regularis]GLW31907.1 VTC domain-containing protein [Actinoplanes regularis]SNS47455.1 VTC domain-containing protein [Actinoplanes regularis]
MSELASESALVGLEAISLAELTEKAALQVRVDRKYVLRLEDALALLPAIDPATRVLEIDGLRTFRYRSVYFDTPDLVCFRLTAQRRRRRFKIRTRTYVDSAECWLEVKTEGWRGGTVKNRLPYESADEDTVEPGHWFVAGVLGDRAVAGLAPTLVTRYNRTTFHQAAGDSRATLDTDLTWTGTDGAELVAPHLAVIETKTAAAASPIDRLLWANGHRPARISKYATGLAALRPELPSAPWRRTLRRHFDR